MIFLLLFTAVGCFSTKEVQTTRTRRSTVFPEDVAATLFGSPKPVRPETAGKRETPPAAIAEPALMKRPGVEAEPMDNEDLAEPEPDQTLALEVKELEKTGRWEEGAASSAAVTEEVTYDFPVTINRQVEYYLDFFSNKQKKTFTTWLERSGRYLPMIQKELKAADLPLDLAYLPMIESGYNLTAYSRAKAAGPWQFIESTGRLFGLTIDRYVDERRDPIRSTRAAIDFLAELYNDFGSWHLAVAGYNAGPGKIRGAIKRHKTKNFWEIAETRYLSAETRRYVPKLIAAIIIAKNPAKYGFTNINYEPPLDFETAVVPRWTSLRAVAVAGNIDLEELHNLNRELRQLMTPPAGDYVIKVPVGLQKLVDTNLPRVRASVSTGYKTHIVRKGETISTICRSYNLNKTTLLKSNSLRSSEIKIGQRLRIPQQTATYVLLSEEEIRQYTVSSNAGDNLVLHTIKPGETISNIANQYNVPVHLIAGWNDIKDIHRIRAGTQMALYLRNSDMPVGRQNASSASVARIAARKPVYYKVQNGDSLWTIAKKFNTSAEMIKEWNDLKSDLIHPGKSLVMN